MIDAHVSAWIPALLLVVLSFAARLLSKSWFAPAPFALAISCIYLVLPLLIASEYQVSPLGVWLIVFLVCCIGLGADLGTGRSTAAEGGAPRELPGPRQMLRLSLIFTLVALTGAIYWTWEALVQNYLDFSVTGLLSLGLVLSRERYSGEQLPFLVRALITWVFPAALLGGMSLAIVRAKRHRLLCFLPLVPAILLTVTEATKANTLMAAALGLGGYLATKIFMSGGNFQVLTRKTLLILSVGLAAALLLLWGTDALRLRKLQEYQVEPDWGRAKSTALGYLAVFSHWASSPKDLGGFRLKWGTYTFGGVFELFGVYQRELGVIPETVDLQGNASNVYTGFRSLIEDFSLPGAGLFCVLFGFFSGCAYRKCISGEKTWIPVLSIFYVFLLWWPLGSLFVYNGSILALLMGVMVLRNRTKGTRRRQKLSNSVNRYLRTA